MLPHEGWRGWQQEQVPHIGGVDDMLVRRIKFDGGHIAISRFGLQALKVVPTDVVAEPALAVVPISPVDRQPRHTVRFIPDNHDERAASVGTDGDPAKWRIARPMLLSNRNQMLGKMGIALLPFQKLLGRRQP